MYHLEITNTGDSSFNVQAKGHNIIVDTKEKGMMPTEVFLTSLGSCVGVYVRKYAEGKKLNLPEFKITVDAELSKDAPVCFRKIELKIDLKGANLDEKTLGSIHRFVENCPVHNTIKYNPEINIKIS